MFFFPSVWEFFFFLYLVQLAVQKGEPVPPQHQKCKVLCLAYRTFYLSPFTLCGNTFPVNGRFAFTAKLYKFMRQNCCLCKLAEFCQTCLTEVIMDYAGVKILSCTQLMVAKREVLDLVFSWAFATLTSTLTLLKKCI